MRASPNGTGSTLESRSGFVIIAFVAALACAGPAGKEGPQGPSGAVPDAGPTPDAGPGPTAALTAETCSICHGTGQIADDITLHKAAASPSLVRSYATITAVTIPATAPITPTITFTVRDAPTGGNPVTGLSSFNFTVAQLVQTDADAGSIDNWQSLLTRNYGTAPDISPGGAVEISVNARTATTPAAQKSGVLTESPAGTYTYTFGNDLSAIQTLTANINYGIVTVAFDPSFTTRIGVLSGAPLPGQSPTTAGNGTVIQPTPPVSATVDVLAGGAVANPSDSRQIVTAQACDQCHQRLTAHGRRVNVNFCVTCHNSSSFDPNTPANARQTVDFKRVVHKLHMGKNLPSVKAGGTFLFHGVDFSDVTFPRMTSNGTSDTGDCTVCHNASSGTAGAPADYWKTKPAIVACSSCHDGIDFTSTTLASCNTSPAPFPCAHSGGPQTNEAGCALCHSTGSGIAGAAIDVAHTGLASVQQSLTGKYRYTIVSVANTAPGQFPVVTFSVTNPASGNSAYNLTEAPWTQTANGNSRLAIDIAWTTRATPTPANTNYTNEGSGANPGQPVTIDALAKKVAGSTAGQFTVTSAVAVPANAVGVGEVVMEGHPAEPVGTPAVQQRIPVQSATKTFAITGTATTARRAAVDINKCNACHGNLTLHGNNRTSRIEACVACHNTNATDINQRPKTGTTVDGLAEASIDFKKLIHGIHGADFSGAGPVIYGFGGSVNDFRGAGFPGVINNCEGCHNPGTYSASFAPAQGTTTSTETLADPSTYLRTTPITATCSACHATGLFLSHMRQNGGAFEVTQPQIDAAQ